MNSTARLASIGEASALIEAGRYLTVAGDEEALKRLPKGYWIGGTIPYFMGEEGGTIARDRVFINEIAAFDPAPTLRLYDADTLSQVCRNAPEQGYTVMIVPAFSSCHVAFAENAPNYEDMYMKPLVGWVAGVHLDDLGKTSPKVVLGTTGEFSDQHAVVMDVPLPEGSLATIDIVNLFRPGEGESITFNATGFSAGDCQINGKNANLAEYLTSGKIDTQLPLVADYCGAMINVSIKKVDVSACTVDFYAPVFPGVHYRIAAPVGDYVAAFQEAVPNFDAGGVFSCKCVLNFLYSDLEGKRTGNITGPVTFGEIAYQLLNQTLVYLTVSV
jgi:hypothetical protein